TSRSTGYYSGYASDQEPMGVSGSVSTQDHDHGYRAYSEHAVAASIRTARGVYKDSVLWHGTSMQSKLDLRSRGFDVDRKAGGAIEAAKQKNSAVDKTLVKNSKRHNYFTSDKKFARVFATTASPTNPALVRTIGVKNNLNIKLDSDTRDENNEIILTCFRTKSSIPKQYVVGSKSSDPGPDAVVFKSELANAGVNVSTRRAGELLRAVQSDSEDDFSSSARYNLTLEGRN
ncbi:hypothetical protein, partial [Pseudomonas savastanoi]